MRFRIGSVGSSKEATPLYVRVDYSTLRRIS